MIPDPLVSIVMPSFNQAEFITASIESVLKQDYRHLQLIISDGGSTDGTVDILRDISRDDARLIWWSAEDDGPANAINMALARAQGEIIGWLNSDDLYKEGAIQRAVDALTGPGHAIMCYGHGEHVDESGAWLDTYPTKPPEIGIDAFSAGCFICQPTVFFKHTMYQLLGPLDETLKTTFDFDYWLRAFKSFQGRISFIDDIQARSRLHGDCITQRMRRQVALEGLQTVHRHLGHGPKHWLATYLEEITEDSQAGGGIDDFVSHLDALLEEAAPFLRDEDRDGLCASFSRVAMEARRAKTAEVIAQ
ncbi:MAG: glycosyltransferase family 2 protein [Pseudomonadota bacterium]